MNKILFLTFILLLPAISFAGATGEVLGDTAKGAVVGGAVGAVQTKVGKEVIGEGMSKKLGDFFDSPPGILLVSSMATVYSGTLYSAAAEQEKEAEDNIKKIDRIMAEFKDSYIFYCPNGREDLTNAECYCYLPKGGENPDRTKSKTCVDLWAKNKYRLNALAGEYKGISKFVDPAGCLTISGQFDENCKCKKFVDAKGGNACMKSVSVSIPSGMTAAMMNGTGLKDVMQLAANTGNGNPMFGNFGNGLGLKAISTDNLKKTMFQKLIPASANGSGLSILNESNVDKLANAMIGEKNIAAAMSNSSSATGVASSELSDKGAASLLKTAASKAGLESYGSGRGLQNKKAEAKDGLNFNFMGDTANAGASQAQNFPEVEKNYNYKGSDISKASDTSIFEIISNRYIQSGLKRLFDE